PLPGNRLFQVPADQLGHLEHRDRALAAEDRLELVVGVDHALVLLVLEAVALDVAPDLLGDLGARHRARSDHRRERGARGHCLHEGCIWLTLLAALLRLLFRHLDFSSEDCRCDRTRCCRYGLAVTRRCTIWRTDVNDFQRENEPRSLACANPATPPEGICIDSFPWNHACAASAES